MRTLLFWTIGTLLVGLVLYGLWYVHNDHPFVAAMLGGFFYLLQLRMVGYWTVQGWEKPFGQLYNRIARIEARLEEDEQRMDELEVPEDEEPWGM